jgi:hypothetical protein
MADNILFSNNASSLLAASISDVDTTVQVAAGFGALFPSPSGGKFFYATLEDDAGNLEIVKCTSRTGDNLTVVRAQDGTTAQAFTLTVTRVELRVVKIVVEEFLQKNGGTMTGILDMNGLAITDAVLSGAATQMLNGEIVAVPMRGAAGVSSNELAVPAAPGRATAGGAAIVVTGDAVVSQATESAAGISERADQTEMNTGTDDLRHVTPKKFKDTQATAAIQGTVSLAESADMTADTMVNATDAITPALLQERTPTNSRAGLVERATQAEVDAGTDNERYVTPDRLANTTLAVGTPPTSNTFTGTSTISCLTPGKKYAVTVYGVNRVGATTGNDTLGGIRVGDGLSVGGGTELADTPNATINWPDGQAGHTHTHIITAASANINGTVDHVSGGQFMPAKAMTAIQLD